MKKFLLFFSISLFTATILSQSLLKIMTYNIRRMGNDPVEHQWDNRKSLVFNTIKSLEAAVGGLQEVAVGQQYDDLIKELSGYKLFGEDRNKYKAGWWWQKFVTSWTSAKNECNPIFYDPNKVELIEQGTFGINPYGKIFMHATLPRIVTWGRFKDKTMNNEFLFYNTHLSTSGIKKFEGSEEIRSKQVDLILDHVQQQEKKLSKNTPIFIVGDFNTEMKGEIKEKFEKYGFALAKDKAQRKEGPDHTRTGWNDKQLKEIDHIMVKNADVLKHKVVENKEGKYPSDHRPVAAEVVLK